jgi:hypothetical protein
VASNGLKAFQSAFRSVSCLFTLHFFQVKKDQEDDQRAPAISRIRTCTQLTANAFLKSLQSLVSMYVSCSCKCTFFTPAIVVCCSQQKVIDATNIHTVRFSFTTLVYYPPRRQRLATFSINQPTTTASSSQTTQPKPKSSANNTNSNYSITRHNSNNIRPRRYRPNPPPVWPPAAWRPDRLPRAHRLRQDSFPLRHHHLDHPPQILATLQILPLHPAFG